MKRKSKSKTADHSKENDNTDEPPAKKKPNRTSKGGKKSKDENGFSNTSHNESSTKNSNDGEYEVEAVLDEKKIRGVKHYLIRWKGYEPESDTWEPESTLDCSAMIREFKNKQKHAKNKPKKASNRNLNKSDPKWDENENFEVERIIDVYFKKNGSREFLVSWKGYPASANTWEPEENMDCKDMIRKFMDRVKRAQEVDVRELRTNRTHTDRFTLSTQSHSRRLSKRHQGKQRVHYHDAE